jgi:hypothetical protein
MLAQLAVDKLFDQTKQKGGIDNSIPPVRLFSSNSVLVTPIPVSITVLKTLTEVLLIQCSAT